LFSNYFLLNLGFRLDVPIGVPLLKGSLPRAASQWRWSCAGLRLSKNSRFLPSSIPSFLPKAGAKVQLFTIRATFFSIILKLFCIALFINILQTSTFSNY
jgi:hypothetical protein